MSVALIVLIVAVALPFFWVVGAYNRLAGLRGTVRDAYAQMDRQIKRRHLLAATLIGAVKNSMEDDPALLETVGSARSRAVNVNQTISPLPSSTEAIAGIAQAEAELSDALRRLLAFASAHDALKANTDVMRLVADLAESESSIGIAGLGYNASAMLYNTGLDEAPARYIGILFRFTPAPLLPASGSLQFHGIGAAAE